MWCMGGPTYFQVWCMVLVPETLVDFYAHDLIDPALYQPDKLIMQVSLSCQSEGLRNC